MAKRKSATLPNCLYCGDKLYTRIEDGINVIACHCGVTYSQYDLTAKGWAEMKAVRAKYDDRMKPLDKPKRIYTPAVITPGIKKCTRCGREFENPIPFPRNVDAPTPELLHCDIASAEYCANCNRVIMSAIYRNNSVYSDQSLPFGGTSASTQSPDGAIEFPLSQKIIDALQEK